jgi:hypothetical protein
MRLFFRYLTFLFLIIGFLFIINPFQSITGNVILDDIDIKVNYIAGLLFIIGGVILLYVSGEERESVRNKEGKIVSIVKTHAFSKATKKQDPAIIYAAIQKIGTGLGREEKLKSGGYSIRTSKGGRIVYNKKGNDYELVDFTHDHKY